MGDPGPSTALLFVYGTLMMGEAAHALLAGARPLGEATTGPEWTLVDCGAFPALTAPGRTVVRGELYEIESGRLADLDAYEGHPTLFVRVTIALADGRQAQTYVLSGRAAGLRPIPSGSWRAHRDERSV